MQSLENHRPIFKKENLIYEREEKDSNWTILPKFHPETRELIINRTAKEVLMYCDGTRTIEEIVKAMKDKYQNAAIELIRNDVHNTLASFSRLMIIQWENENPFLFKRERIISDETFFRIGVEEDILEIKAFIEKSGISEKKLEQKENSELFLYRSSLIDPINEYSEVAMRQKMFRYYEDFFIYFNKKEILSLISIALPMPPNQAASFNLVIAKKSILKDLLRYSADNLPFISVFKIRKIKLYEDMNEKLSPEFEKIFVDEGYKQEGILRDELGLNHDLRIMSWIYDPLFIDEVEKQRSNITYN
ncbi:MAG: PqqD family protein [bacterium]